MSGKRLALTVLASLLLLPVLFTDRLAATGSGPDPRFGAVSAFWLPERAQALDLGWERILFYWSQIQPSGPEDWNTLHVMEEWLEEAEAQNRQVVGLLKNTPPWATDGVPYGGVPRGLYLPIDDPDNLWAVFVRRVAEYYGPRGVHNWIIWNEPDIDQGVYGSEWAGSVEDYYQLVKVAYLVLKEADPQATVHLAGLTYWHDVVAGREQYLRRFLRVAGADPQAEENDYFFDVLSLHIYFRSETVGSIVRQIDEIQNSFGLDKPIWINETNAAPTEDPLWPVTRPQFQLNLDQQAWFIVQAHALGFAGGAERIAVYKLFDVGLEPGAESFGLIRADGTIRPGYYAHQNTIRVLQDFSDVRAQGGEAYHDVVFRRPRGTTRVLWARTPMSVTVSVPANLSEATLLSATGDGTTIKPAEGAYSVTLKGADCAGECIIGGPPLFLVEQLPEPTATPTATPTSTATPSATPTSTATPTPLPTAVATGTPTAQAETEVEVTPTVAAAAAGGPGSPSLPLVPTSSMWLVGVGIALGLVLFVGLWAGFWRRQ